MEEDSSKNVNKFIEDGKKMNRASGTSSKQANWGTGVCKGRGMGTNHSRKVSLSCRAP